MTIVTLKRIPRNLYNCLNTRAAVRQNCTVTDAVTTPTVASRAAALRHAGCDVMTQRHAGCDVIICRHALASGWICDECDDVNVEGRIGRAGVSACFVEVVRTAALFIRAFCSFALLLDCCLSPEEKTMEGRLT